jgi:hypothetical protein
VSQHEDVGEHGQRRDDGHRHIRAGEAWQRGGMTRTSGARQSQMTSR